MMSEPKPFASLSSGLLARKGAAKPAMRPAAFGQIGASLDDLGWNDMGQGYPPHEQEQQFEAAHTEHVPSSISALTPAPRSSEQAASEAKAFEAAEELELQEEIAPTPPVALQQRAIAETFGEPEAEAEAPVTKVKPRKAAVVPLPKRAPTAARTTKAAFTLRLDADRPLKLRLACALTGRSAQQIVTQGLDDILKTFPEVETLAGQVPAKSVNRN